MNRNNQDGINFFYEDRTAPDDELMCLIIYGGTEYRFQYKHMSHIARLYDVPEPVREYLLHWAQMLNNPD